MKEPIVRLRNLELVLMHLASVHPGLFADMDPEIMPEATPTPEPEVGGGPENPPVPPEPDPEPEPEPEPTPTPEVVPQMRASGRGRRS